MSLSTGLIISKSLVAVVMSLCASVVSEILTKPANTKLTFSAPVQWKLSLLKLHTE